MTITHKHALWLCKKKVSIRKNCIKNAIGDDGSYSLATSGRPKGPHSCSAAVEIAGAFFRSNIDSIVVSTNATRNVYDILEYVPSFLSLFLFFPYMQRGTCKAVTVHFVESFHYNILPIMHINIFSLESSVPTH